MLGKNVDKRLQMRKQWSLGLNKTALCVWINLDWSRFNFHASLFSKEPNYSILLGLIGEKPMPYLGFFPVVSHVEKKSKQKVFSQGFMSRGFWSKQLR